MADQFFNSIDDYVGLQTASIALLSLAVIPIVAGSICSLKLLGNPFSNAVKTEKKSPSPRAARSSRSRSRSTSVHRYHTRSQDYQDSSDDEDLIEKIDISKVINVKDTLLFPIIASVLVYVSSHLIETVDPLYVNNAIMVLTSILSMTVFSSTTAIVAESILPKQVFDSVGRFKFSYTKRDKKLCHLNVTLIHLFIIAVSIGLAVTYAWTQHWVVSNLYAICISIQAIRCLTLDSFGTGYLLLLGMMAYDMFWVFGTDTMEYLSKVLVYAPTSVMWPRNINTYVHNTLLKSDNYFTMFGLGEIIVPGIFIAYCLRMDQSNAWRSKKSTSSFRKPYFTLALISYVLTAGASIYTVHFTKQSQSAFLYVVPALILTTLALAIYRGELSAVWDVSDILETFKEINGFHTEEYRPTREERLADRQGNTRSSRSVSASARRGSTVGVVDEVFDETRKMVAPIIEEAAEVTYNAAEEARKAVTPFYEEAVKSTTRAVHAVATKVQEQTALDEDTTIEQDVVAQHRNDPVRSTSRGRGRGGGRSRARGRSRSTSVAARKRSSSRASKKNA